MRQAPALESGPRPARSAGPYQLWPWRTGLALASVPIILAVLLAIYAVMRANFGWPHDQYEGWLLLAILMLSLLPVFLLVLGLLASVGGTVEAPGGVRVSFTGASEQAAGTVSSARLSENLGTVDASPAALNQSSLQNILGALRTAHASDVTVVDIGQGKTWWESRLFILIAGAARRGRPEAIAFVHDANGISGVFIGWASPQKLLESHLKFNPRFRDPYNRARSIARQWDLGIPQQTPTGLPAVTLPWGGQLPLPQVRNAEANFDYSEFAFELFLQKELDIQPDETLRQHMNVNDLLDLYRPILITDEIDVGADDDQWARLLNANSRRFFAMVDNGILRDLVPREALMSALLVPLAKQPN